MPADRPLIRRTAALAAAGGVVALSMRALSRPRAGAEHALIDWEAVRRTARARSGQRSPLRRAQAERLASRYDVIAAEMVPLIAEVCGSPPAGIPRVTVLDRHGAIDANLAIVRRLLEPVEEMRGPIPVTALTALGRRFTSRYVGEVLGFMSQRVLGQYDPVLMLPAPAFPAASGGAGRAGRPPAALYVVEPNVLTLQRGQNAPAEPLRRWLILHEATHAWQFEAHPWLGAHIGGLMSELLAAVAGDDPDPSGRRGLGSAALHRMGATVAVQLRGMGRLQAIMSVLEGYSNLVMHRVGRSQIEDFDQLEEAFHRRRASRSLLERLILGLTGISLKMRQYDQGERFCEALIADGGYRLLNRVWDGPEMMPTMAEIHAPDRWIARVGGAAGPARHTH